MARYNRLLVMGFIIFSTVVFYFIGEPAKILVVVGAINGFILPISLAILLIAAKKKDIIGKYHHSWFLTITGWFVVVFMLYASVEAVLNLL